MTDDAGFARAANSGVGLVGLLDHRAGKTREFYRCTAQHRLAEIEIAEQTIERVVEWVVGRCGEVGVIRLRPMIRGGDWERVLARKMMEEGAFRHGGLA